MKSSIRYRRQGMALIVVLLIIMSLTGAALYALSSTQVEAQSTTVFRYHRQAAQAAHQSGSYLRMLLNQDAILLNEINRQKSMNAVGEALASGDVESAWHGMAQSQEWYYPEQITPFSGLGIQVPSSSDPKRLKGDLSRSISQAGSIRREAHSNLIVEGFSESNHYCSYVMKIDAYALVGRPVQLREDSYYLANDFNVRGSALKREMATVLLTPISCN